MAITTATTGEVCENTQRLKAGQNATNVSRTRKLNIRQPPTLHLLKSDSSRVSNIQNLLSDRRASRWWWDPSTIWDESSSLIFFLSFSFPSLVPRWVGGEIVKSFEESADSSCMRWNQESWVCRDGLNFLCSPRLPRCFWALTLCPPPANAFSCSPNADGSNTKNLGHFDKTWGDIFKHSLWSHCGGYHLLQCVGENLICCQQTINSKNHSHLFKAKSDAWLIWGLMKVLTQLGWFRRGRCRGPNWNSFYINQSDCSSETHRKICNVWSTT